MSQSINRVFRFGELAPQKPQYRRRNRPAVLFSDADADLSELNWRIDDRGYAVIGRTIDGKPTNIFAHRVVLSRMLGRVPTSKDICDHINGTKPDNRRENLRLVSAYENAQNVGPNRDSITGIRNVTWCKSRKKWLVIVGHKGRNYNGGYYTDINEAAAAAASTRKRLGFAEGTPVIRGKTHRADSSLEKSTLEMGCFNTPAPTGIEFSRTEPPSPLRDSTHTEGSGPHGCGDLNIPGQPTKVVPH